MLRFTNPFKRKKSRFSILKGEATVPVEELGKTRTLHVPVRCKDGTIVDEERQMPEAVARAMESVFARLMVDGDLYFDIVQQKRKSTGKVKVTALLGVMHK